MDILKEITCHYRLLTGGGSTTDIDDGHPLTVEAVTETSRIIAREVLCNQVLKSSTSIQNGSNAIYVRTMLRVIKDLSSKHEIVFEKNVKSVVGESKNGAGHSLEEALNEIVKDMLKDGQKNWGRVVAIYTFSYCAARYCAEHGMSNMVESIADATGTCVANHLSEWILNQGGWDSFEKQFHQEDSTESKIWTGLVCTLVGLGTLATITVLK